MSTPENTTARPPEVNMLGIMVEGQDAYITGMEAAGQRELVASDKLPTDLNGTHSSAFTDLGFVFGEPVEGDPMFMTATLPEGWTREGSDHDMWSYLVDERGIRRVSIFYKAAFYDRRAHMGLTNVGWYLAHEFLYNGEACEKHETDTEPHPIPWDVLTETERHGVLQALADWAADDFKRESYPKRTAKAVAEYDRLSALA